ncbi:jmjC domain-containing protein 8 isoform X2 [Alligator mississippiensis]|uniref:jmjC domain-containing protein 8 isoform X2 n=1 Tax=Alligator mississippiensis TaxID=8496 RepID=UPI0028775A4F|nr:jmjC domain-containing protein 8 isoform X2 [Alligator mississippiensis]
MGPVRAEPAGCRSPWGGAGPTSPLPALGRGRCRDYSSQGAARRAGPPFPQLCPAFSAPRLDWRCRRDGAAAAAGAARVRPAPALPGPGRRLGGRGAGGGAALHGGAGGRGAELRALRGAVTGAPWGGAGRWGPRRRAQRSAPAGSPSPGPSSYAASRTTRLSGRCAPGTGCWRPSGSAGCGSAPPTPTRTAKEYVEHLLEPQDLDLLGSDTLYFFGDNNFTEWGSLFQKYVPPPFRLPGTTSAYSFGIAALVPVPTRAHT